MTACLVPVSQAKGDMLNCLVFLGMTQDDTRQALAQGNAFPLPHSSTVYKGSAHMLRPLNAARSLTMRLTTFLLPVLTACIPAFAQEGNNTEASEYVSTVTNALK
jgi:hypothetical protein